MSTGSVLRCALVALLGISVLSTACRRTTLAPDLQARFESATALEQRGFNRRAITEFEALRAAAPDHKETRVALARLYADSGRFDLAEAEIEAVLKLDRNYSPAYAARGRSLYLQQRPQEARRALEEAASRFPESEPVLGELGLLDSLLGDAARALTAFERIRSPRGSLPYLVALHWARALDDSGRGAEAVALYRAAIDRAPDRGAEAHAHLGALLLRDGGAAGATEGSTLLEEALRRQPGEPEILALAGEAFLASGRTEEARNTLQRALHASRPDSPERTRFATLLARAESLAPAAVAPVGSPNVVLVVIDTLRRDHVGAYGYSRNTTPVLDRLAREGVVVDDAVSQAPWTAASIATMFTGLYPSVHGLDGGVRWGVPRGAAGGALRFAVQKTLRPSQVTLAELFRRRGYRTAGFVSNTYVNSIFGFAQGFELFHDEHDDYSTHVGGKRRGADTNALVFDWLSHSPREPFFLFVHYNDPHLPYDPPPPHGRDWSRGYTGRLTPQASGAAAERQGAPAADLDPEDVRYLAALYDGEIHYADEQLGRLMERLAGLRLSRSILTVVTSDHGEEFLDHGSMSHGFTLFEEQLRVPLVFHQPDRLARHRAVGPFGLIDLAPTVAALAGIADTLPQVQGQDRSGLLRGAADRPPPLTFSEATYAKALRAIRRPMGLKLITGPDGSDDLLFDLASDPVERNVLPSIPGAADLRRALDEWASANSTLHDRLHHGQTPAEVVLDEETEERLKSLGYIR